MKKYSLKHTFFILLFVFAIIASLAVIIYFNIFYGSIRWKLALLVLLSVFFSGLGLYFFVRNVILNKIDDLIQSVKTFRANTDKSDKIIIDENSSLSINHEIESLNHEIISWSEERKNEIERLKKLEVYRKEYLGNVSHELKTPIFNIQGYVLTLLDGGIDDPSINKNYLQRAEKSIDRMIGIIDDLEAISQLETGELQLEPEKFDLVALIKDVIDAQEMNVTKRGIMLSVTDYGKSFIVYADKFRIRQVLVNLIINSVKYGKEYGETKIRLMDGGENIVVEVADNGIGIDKEHLPRLFERFYRVDKSRSRDIGGTGLGLAIVKHIIEAHNQTIHVMSTPGVGTVFNFTLKKAKD